MKASVLIMRAIDGSFVSPEVSESVLPLKHMAMQARASGEHEGIPIDRGTIVQTDRGACRVAFRFICSKTAKAPAEKPAKGRRSKD